MDGPFGKYGYTTGQGECLKRLYTDTCRFTLAPEIMSIIDANPAYSSFLPIFEDVPHGTPHACIGGNMDALHGYLCLLSVLCT